MRGSSSFARLDVSKKKPALAGRVFVSHKGEWVWKGKEWIGKFAIDK